MSIEENKTPDNNGIQKELNASDSGKELEVKEKEVLDNKEENKTDETKDSAKAPPGWEWAIPEVTKLRAEKRSMAEELAKLKAAPPKEEKKADVTVQLTQAQITAEANRLVQQKLWDDKCDQVFNDGKSEFTDFPAKLEVLKNTIGGLPTQFLDVALESPQSHKLIYHLSNNLGEAQRIFALPQGKMALEVARLEGKLAEGRKISEAPDPHPIIKGKGGAGDFAFDDESTDTSDWIAKRNEDLKKRGKRLY